jgi:hypothetical protein
VDVWNLNFFRAQRDEVTQYFDKSSNLWQDETVLLRQIPYLMYVGVVLSVLKPTLKKEYHTRRRQQIIIVYNYKPQPLSVLFHYEIRANMGSQETWFVHFFLNCLCELRIIATFRLELWNRSRSNYKVTQRHCELARIQNGEFTASRDYLQYASIISHTNRGVRLSSFTRLFDLNQDGVDVCDHYL